MKGVSLIYFHPHIGTYFVFQCPCMIQKYFAMLKKKKQKNPTFYLLKIQWLYIIFTFGIL